MESIIYERRGGRGWVTIRVIRGGEAGPLRLRSGQTLHSASARLAKEASRKDKADAPVGMTDKGGDERHG